MGHAPASGMLAGEVFQKGFLGFSCGMPDDPGLRDVAQEKLLRWASNQYSAGC